MSLDTTQLKQLLKQDLSDLDQLSQTLSHEKSLLSGRDTKAIDASTKQKQQLIKQIESRAKQKAQLLSNSGLGIKPGQVIKALDTLKDPELSALWRNSVTQLKACKERNAVNGSIIERTLQRTATLMSIVRGQNSAPKLYGNAGKTKAVSNSQILGKA